MIDDQRFMRAALKEAEAAGRKGEVPVGCVIVRDRRVIARAANGRETRMDPVAHAEILAIQAAAQTIGSWRLEGCTLYVTLEPCAMCAGAIVLARIEKLVYGAADPKAGYCHSLGSIVSDPRLNHRPLVIHGLLEKECSDLLSRFFRELRARQSAASTLL